MQKIADYIKVYYNFVDKDFCDEIVNTVENSDKWENAEVRGDVEDYRQCDNINLMKFPELDMKFLEVSRNIILKYSEEIKHVHIEGDTGYNVLRYKTGDFYKEHVDVTIDEVRNYTASVVLNDEFEGGDFSFFNRELMYKLTKGDVIVFPSNVVFPHEVIPITKGTRYSIVTWYG